MEIDWGPEKRYCSSRQRICKNARCVGARAISCGGWLIQHKKIKRLIDKSYYKFWRALKMPSFGAISAQSRVRQTTLSAICFDLGLERSSTLFMYFFY